MTFVDPAGHTTLSGWCGRLPGTFGD